MDNLNDQTAAGAYSPVIRSLMTVGLLGSMYARHADAQNVSSAVELTIGDSLSYRMNRAIALGMGGDASLAVEQLVRHLEAHPQDDTARVAVALSMLMGGDPGWVQVIQNVLASSSDPQAREAAMNIVNYLRLRAQ